MPFRHCTAPQWPTVVQQGKSVQPACWPLRWGWGGILDLEGRPTWAGPLPGSKVPSDPRDTGLARISSFHGEQSKMSRGKERPAGLRGPAREVGEGCSEEVFYKAGPRCFDNIIALLLRAQ